MTGPHPQAQEVIKVGRLEIRYLQEAGEGCRMGCFEMRIPPGSNVPPPHRHPGNEELVYVLDGTLRYSVGASTRDLGPGDFMSTPPGEVHAFANPFDTPVRALVINTPDIGAGFFRQVGAILDAGGPPDHAKLIAAMASYGLSPAALPPEPGPDGTSAGRP